MTEVLTNFLQSKNKLPYLTVHSSNIGISLIWSMTKKYLQITCRKGCMSEKLCRNGDGNMVCGDGIGTRSVEMERGCEQCCGYGVEMKTNCSPSAALKVSSLIINYQITVDRRGKFISNNTPNTCQISYLKLLHELLFNRFYVSDHLP